MSNTKSLRRKFSLPKFNEVAKIRLERRAWSMKKKIKDFKEFNSSKTRIRKVNDCLIFMLAMKKLNFIWSKNFFSD
jgi:hypothetical protein